MANTSGVHPPLSQQSASVIPGGTHWVRRAIVFGSAIVAFAILMVILYADHEREKTREQLVAHTYQVIDAIQTLLSTLQDAETGQRGYLLTGDDRYRKPFDSALREETSVRGTLRQLTSDEPAQQSRLDSVDRLVAAKVSELRTTIALRRKEGLNAALSVVRTDEGEQIMDESRRTLEAMEQEERMLLEKRTAEANVPDAEMRWGLGFGGGGILILLVIASAVIERDNRRLELTSLTARRSEHRMRMALDAAGAGTWEWDPQTGRNFWSEQLWKIYGLRPDSCQPSNAAWIQVVHPDDRASVERTLSEAERDGSELNMEFRVCDSDGKVRWAVTHARPLRDGPGNMIFDGIVLDITERKKAEEEQHERETHRLRVHLASILASTDDAVIIKDLEGTIHDWNHGAERLYGYSAEEVAGRKVAILIPPERLDEHRAMLEKLRRAEPVQSFETERVCKFGRKIYVSLTVTPVKDTAGLIEGACEIARDISERIRAEQEIQELNASLERRVSERTAELVAANKELEGFSYSVSHDLRSPLRAMEGFSRILLEDYADKLDAQGKDCLQRVRAASMRMDQLIDGILGLARLARSEIQRTRVDLSALAESIVLELQKTDPQRPVEFAIAPGLVAYADATLLRAVMVNLLNNAWKFTGKHACARIEVGATSCEGKTAYFVKDDGAGFDMAFTDKLFGVFQRLHAPGEFEGTGIGLTTVQRIIRRHGGTIWAEAAVEKGATFFFTLPDSSR